MPEHLGRQDPVHPVHLRGGCSRPLVGDLERTVVGLGAEAAAALEQVGSVPHEVIDLHVAQAVRRSGVVKQRVVGVLVGVVDGLRIRPRSYQAFASVPITRGCAAVVTNARNDR